MRGFGNMGNMGGMGGMAGLMKQAQKAMQQAQQAQQELADTTVEGSAGMLGGTGRGSPVNRQMAHVNTHECGVSRT